jgi:lipopolysaccharide export system permease protein
VSRIDRVVLSRLGSRIGTTVLVFYGIIILVESLDTWRFNFVAENQGFPLALLMVAMSAVRWTIKTLPVTVLMGAILGFMELKLRHELTVIQASGISIWRMMRAPLLGLFAASLIISLGAETLSTVVNRSLYAIPPQQSTLQTTTGEVWLEQSGGDAHYLIRSEGIRDNGTRLVNVTVFLLEGGTESRIESTRALLENGRWLFPKATIRNVADGVRVARDFSLPTTSTQADIELKLTSPDDLTFIEIAQLLAGSAGDPAFRAAARMRLIKLFALPLVLCGSLLIAIAFTAGYRRASNYGPAVLYGIVLGFVVFVITEMADRAGSTGVLDPTFAAVGPAFVAIVIGVTVLLYKEDGRA